MTLFKIKKNTKKILILVCDEFKKKTCTRRDRSSIRLYKRIFISIRWGRKVLKSILNDNSCSYFKISCFIKRLLNVLIFAKTGYHLNGCRRKMYKI